MSAQPRTVRESLIDLRAHEVLRRADLIDRGMTTHQITAAVRQRQLLRVRRGVYVRSDTPVQVAAAIRVGGRLTCLSLLQMIGIFVHSNTRLHVHVPSDLSRSRSRRPESAILHWGRDADSGHDHLVTVWDAIRQAVLCQHPRASVATFDSLLHHGLIAHADLVRLLDGLPRRYRALIALVDALAESGPETYMRLILRSLGVRFECQVRIDGVGRVDFLVEGWLIIECDSKTFHEGWDKQVEDRAREVAAARLGYVTIRPIASDLLDDRARVRADVAAVLEAFGRRLAPTRAPQLRRNGPESASVQRKTSALL